jgi:hypothetical protein
MRLTELDDICAAVRDHGLVISVHPSTHMDELAHQFGFGFAQLVPYAAGMKSP